MGPSVLQSSPASAHCSSFAHGTTGSSPPLVSPPRVQDRLLDITSHPKLAAQQEKSPKAGAGPAQPVVPLPPWSRGRSRQGGHGPGWDPPAGSTRSQLFVSHGGQGAQVRSQIELIWGLSCFKSPITVMASAFPSFVFQMVFFPSYLLSSNSCFLLLESPHS